MYRTILPDSHHLPAGRTTTLSDSRKAWALRSGGPTTEQGCPRLIEGA
jgi:hypothetical protein